MESRPFPLFLRRQPLRWCCPHSRPRSTRGGVVVVVLGSVVAGLARLRSQGLEMGGGGCLWEGGGWEDEAARVRM